MESLQAAREELKRADHLLYVSLKYTRTVDVLKSLIERLINCIDLVIESLLKRAKEKKNIKEIPTNQGLRLELVKKVYHSDEKILHIMAFYTTLRKISRAEYKRTNEYRRHVTMIATTDEGVINIDLDIIKEHYEKTVEFTDYVDDMLYPKEQQ